MLDVPDSIQAILDDLKSAKVKARNEGCSHLIQSFQNASVREALNDKSYNAVLEALFDVIYSERSTLSVAGGNLKAAAQARLAFYVSTLRKLVELCCQNLQHRCVKSLCAHVSKTLGSKGGRDNVSDYVKICRAIFDFTPHVEHLASEEWQMLVSLLVGLVQFYDSDEPRDPARVKRQKLSLSLQDADILHAIGSLCSASNAAVALQAEPLKLTVLVFLERFPTENAATFSVLKIYRAVVDYYLSNDQGKASSMALVLLRTIHLHGTYKSRAIMNMAQDCLFKSLPLWPNIIEIDSTLHERDILQHLRGIVSPLSNILIKSNAKITNDVTVKGYTTHRGTVDKLSPQRYPVKGEMRNFTIDLATHSQNYTLMLIISHALAIIMQESCQDASISLINRLQMASGTVITECLLDAAFLILEQQLLDEDILRRSFQSSFTELTSLAETGSENMQAQAMFCLGSLLSYARDLDIVLQSVTRKELCRIAIKKFNSRTMSRAAAYLMCMLIRGEFIAHTGLVRMVTTTNELDSLFGVSEYTDAGALAWVSAIRYLIKHSSLDVSKAMSVACSWMSIRLCSMQVAMTESDLNPINGMISTLWPKLLNPQLFSCQSINLQRDIENLCQGLNSKYVWALSSDEFSFDLLDASNVETEYFDSSHVPYNTTGSLCTLLKGCVNTVDKMAFALPLIIRVAFEGEDDCQSELLLALAHDWLQSISRHGANSSLLLLVSAIDSYIDKAVLSKAVSATSVGLRVESMILSLVQLLDDYLYSLCDASNEDASMPSFLSSLTSRTKSRFFVALLKVRFLRCGLEKLEFHEFSRYFDMFESGIAIKALHMFLDLLKLDHWPFHERFSQILVDGILVQIAQNYKYERNSEALYFILQISMIEERRETALKLLTWLKDLIFDSEVTHWVLKSEFLSIASSTGEIADHFDLSNLTLSCLCCEDKRVILSAAKHIPRLLTGRVPRQQRGFFKKCMRSMPRSEADIELCKSRCMLTCVFVQASSVRALCIWSLVEHGHCTLRGQFLQNVIRYITSALGYSKPEDLLRCYAPWVLPLWLDYAPEHGITNFPVSMFSISQQQFLCQYAEYFVPLMAMRQRHHDITAVRTVLGFSEQEIACSTHQSCISIIFADKESRDELGHLRQYAAKGGEVLIGSTGDLSSCILSWLRSLYFDGDSTALVNNGHHELAAKLGAIMLHMIPDENFTCLAHGLNIYEFMLLWDFYTSKVDRRKMVKIAMSIFVELFGSCLTSPDYHAQTQYGIKVLVITYFCLDLILTSRELLKLVLDGVMHTLDDKCSKKAQFEIVETILRQIARLGTEVATEIIEIGGRVLGFYANSLQAHKDRSKTMEEIRPFIISFIALVPSDSVREFILLLLTEPNSTKEEFQRCAERIYDRDQFQCFYDAVRKSYGFDRLIWRRLEDAMGDSTLEDISPGISNLSKCFNLSIAASSPLFARLLASHIIHPVSDDITLTTENTSSTKSAHSSQLTHICLNYLLQKMKASEPSEMRRAAIAIRLTLGIRDLKSVWKNVSPDVLNNYSSQYFDRDTSLAFASKVFKAMTPLYPKPEMSSRDWDKQAIMVSFTQGNTAEKQLSIVMLACLESYDSWFLSEVLGKHIADLMLSDQDTKAYEGFISQNLASNSDIRILTIISESLVKAFNILLALAELTAIQRLLKISEMRLAIKSCMTNGLYEKVLLLIHLEWAFIGSIRDYIPCLQKALKAMPDPDGFYGFEDDQPTFENLLAHTQYEGRSDDTVKLVDSFLEASGCNGYGGSMALPVENTYAILQSANYNGLASLVEDHESHQSDDMHLLRKWDLPSSERTGMTGYVKLLAKLRFESLSLADIHPSNAIWSFFQLNKRPSEEPLVALICAETEELFAETSPSESFITELTNRWDRRTSLVGSGNRLYTLELLKYRTCALQMYHETSNSENVRPAIKKAITAHLLAISQELYHQEYFQKGLSALMQATEVTVEDSSLAADIATSTSQYMWHLGDHRLALRKLESALQGMDATTTGARKLHGEIARYLSAKASKAPMDILSQHLDVATKELKYTEKSEESSSLFYEYATFCERQICDSGALEELERLSRLRNSSSSHVQVLERALKLTEKVSEIKQLRREHKKAKSLHEQYESQYADALQEAEVFKIGALRNYLYCLCTSDSHDQVILNIYSLWMQNATNKDVCSVLLYAMPTVPSYKFISIYGQLSSRLEAIPEESREALLNLLLRCGEEHYYHTVHHLFALSQPVLSDKQDRKLSTKAAGNLLLDLCSKHKIIRDIVRLCQSYADFAEFHLDSKSETVDFSSYPKSNQFIREIPKMKIPPLTRELALSKTSDYSKAPYIVSFKHTISIASGLSAPKIIRLLCSDGETCSELVKHGHDDLRQDSVMEQVFMFANTMLRRHKESRLRNLLIRTYKVVPLARKNGVIEYVKDSTSLMEYLVYAHRKYNPSDMKPEECRKHLHNAQASSKERRIKAYQHVTENFKPAFRFFFLEKYQSPEAWYKAELAYTRASATISIMGYILGLGDRHCNNILLDTKTGEVIHIDLGVAFDQGKHLVMPETVPFRLSRDIVDGMGASGVEGVFRLCSETSLAIMRRERESLKAILDVLRHDPLYSW